jgi:mevalonate kinase
MKTYTAHAKCILSGEHTVIRGGDAIVTAYKKFFLSLTITSSKEVEFVCNDFDEVLIKDLRHLIATAMQHLTNNSLVIPNFRYELTGNFSARKGLGFSAALCSIVADFCCDYVNKVTLKYSLAHFLEHIFHGNSSGLDIVGVNADAIIKFKNMDNFYVIKDRLPFNIAVTFANTEQTIATKDCVKKVLDQKKSNITKFEQVDLQMKQASLLMERAICKICMDSLIESFNLSLDCYEKWGLVSARDRSHIVDLYKKGAIAVRITGAGGSGSFLSVWNEKCLGDLDFL